VREYIRPEIFDRLAGKAKDLGIGTVFAGPLIRSSFSAEEAFSIAVSIASRSF
jgi:lipoate synthase